MSDPNDSNGDPLVRSIDPFTRKHDQTPDEATEGLNEPDGSNGSNDSADKGNGQASQEADQEARQQARKAGSGTTGHEVEAEPNSDMDLEGFDK
jgi:hypothetical protein